MIQFCNEKKGAIAVFLTLILIPVFLLGGLTTDAARIYMSKVVISDAGEMAMNAGLAQYEEKLHDEYGLLVMSKSPQSMSSELATYFNKSLNGTGIAGTEDYGKILDLVAENFEAYNIEGSQIYKTEVEKQQILEYMKYRAPVCLTELLLEKLKELKDTKAMAEAALAQMDFSEAMEECQDTMEIALQKLKDLDADNQAFPSNQTIQGELDSSQIDFQSTISKYIIMKVAIDKFEQAASGDVEGMAQSFIGAAEGVDVDDYPENYFNGYLSALYYQKGVEEAGGIDTLRDQIGSEPDAEADPDGHAAWAARKSEIESLIDNYNSEKNRISEYPGKIESIAEGLIESHFTELNDCYEKAGKGKEDAERAYKALEDVQQALADAKEKWQTWSDKTDAVSNPGEMKGSVDRYAAFFGSTGQQDGNDLEALMEKVNKDKEYYSQIYELLPGEQFYLQVIAMTESSGQYQYYYNEALSSQLSGTTITLDFNPLDYSSNFAQPYKHVTIPANCVLTQITNDPFYNRLQEYCKNAGNGDEGEKSTANEKLSENKDAGENVKKIDGYPNFRWSDKATEHKQELVSNKQKQENESQSNSPKEEMTDIGGSLDDKSARKGCLSKFRKSLEASTNFLDGLDRIVENNLENLYISEYTMQLFSYYTVDKNKDGTERQKDEIIGLSGYNLCKHPGYQAETEYILWGNDDAATNVRNTVLTIFGIRLLLNSFFAFTDPTIVETATASATAIAGLAPYLIPVFQVLIELSYAGVETADDIAKIKQGYGVTIIKSASTWATAPYSGADGGNTTGVTLDYSEYLRIFLNLNMLSEAKEEKILGRIADCIQLNTEFDLLDGYTMLSIDSDIKVRTTFMRKISELGGGRTMDDTYTIKYQSVLGY